VKPTLAALAALIQMATGLQAPALLAAEPADTTTRSAPAPPSPEARFEALVGEIGALRADLEKLDRRERTLLGEIDRFEMEDALRSREIARVAVQKTRATRNSRLPVTRRTDAPDPCGGRHPGRASPADLAKRAASDKSV
jgi:hypothetical protein